MRLLFHFAFALSLSLFFFFFNDTATTEIYTLSLHDALPISARRAAHGRIPAAGGGDRRATRSEPRGGVRPARQRVSTRRRGGATRQPRQRTAAGSGAAAVRTDGS